MDSDCVPLVSGGVNFSAIGVGVTRPELCMSRTDCCSLNSLDSFAAGYARCNALQFPLTMMHGCAYAKVKLCRARAELEVRPVCT